MPTPAAVTVAQVGVALAKPGLLAGAVDQTLEPLKGGHSYGRQDQVAAAAQGFPYPQPQPVAFAHPYPYPGVTSDRS